VASTLCKALPALTLHADLGAEALQLPRAQIWNAVALDYPADSFSDIQLLFEGADGALPNLDALISLAHVAAHEDGVPVRLDAPRPDGQREDEARAALGWLGEQMERGAMGQGAALRYLQGVRNAATQIGRAAGGRPSGVHGLLHRCVSRVAPACRFVLTLRVQLPHRCLHDLRHTS
jgi:glycosylphosphatidylinositol transamidase